MTAMPSGTRRTDMDSATDERWDLSSATVPSAERSAAASIAGSITAAPMAAGGSAAVRDMARADTAMSAFLAGLGGGGLYAVLVAIARRPISVLWMLTLLIATVDSLLIALLPLPARPGVGAGPPFDGLLVPIAQIGALLGLGRFGTTHVPAA